MYRDLPQVGPARYSSLHTGSEELSWTVPKRTIGHDSCRGFGLENAKSCVRCVFPFFLMIRVPRQVFFFSPKGEKRPNSGTRECLRETRQHVIFFLNQKTRIGGLEGMLATVNRRTVGFTVEKVRTSCGKAPNDTENMNRRAWKVHCGSGHRSWRVAL